MNFERNRSSCLSDVFRVNSISKYTLRMNSGSNTNEEEDEEDENHMSNSYRSWSIADDYYLYKFQKEPLTKLASKLGRGLVGIQKRLKKLNDVNSAAYERLFASSAKQNQILASLFTGNVVPNDFNLKIINQSDDDDANDTVLSSHSSERHKLTPARDVLRRIQWDVSLTPSDFIVNYYDRNSDEVMSALFTKPNSSVKGQEELFVLAIPEHRIMSIQYKERVVWDKANRIDYVCGSGKRDDETAATTIQTIIETYPDWKKLTDERNEQFRKRQHEVVFRVKEFLGTDRFRLLKQLSDDFRREGSAPESHLVTQIKSYIKDSLALFTQARDETPPITDDPSGSTNQSLQYTNELFCELVSTLPDERLREAILQELASTGARFGKSKSDLEKSPVTAPEVVELREEDLTEKFCKGGGAGGQKVNKTSNRVILLHNPTNLSVSVHETRSLQQNRKIARKRLLEKLDIYVHGSQSKFAIKAMRDTENKIKAKARRKARLKQRLDQRTNGEFVVVDDDDENDISIVANLNDVPNT